MLTYADLYTHRCDKVHSYSISCFTSPKVQILTQKAVQYSIYFASKKVQILTKMDVCPASYSLDTDEEACVSKLN
jgi:tRNA(His) 5'-end guanylyltransferase